MTKKKSVVKKTRPTVFQKPLTPAEELIKETETTLRIAISAVSAIEDRLSPVLRKAVVAYDEDPRVLPETSPMIDTLRNLNLKIRDSFIRVNGLRNRLTL